MLPYLCIVQMIPPLRKASGCAGGLRLWSSLEDGGSEPFSFGTEGKWTPFLRPAGGSEPPFSVGTGQRWKWTPLLWSWAVRGSEPLSCRQWGEVNPSHVGSEGRWTPPLEVALGCVLPNEPRLKEVNRWQFILMVEAWLNWPHFICIILLPKSVRYRYWTKNENWLRG
jgi:hypothetical protein